MTATNGRAFATDGHKATGFRHLTVVIAARRRLIAVPVGTADQACRFKAAPNVVSMQVPRPAPDAFPHRMPWRDAPGAVVHTFADPSQ
jgi:hypothetical protein